MAVATSTLIIGGIAAAAGGAKAAAGAKQKKEARNAIAAYERQELSNPAESMRISTLGADIQREQSAQMQSNYIDAIKMGGSRAIAAAVPRLGALNNDMNQNIANNLDNQMLNREQAIAQGGNQIQRMQERREEGDLRGLGAQYEAGNQNMWAGFNEIAGAGMYGANNLQGKQPPKDDSTSGFFDINDSALAEQTKINPYDFSSANNNVGYYGIS